MLTLSALTVILGWCLLINSVLLLFVTLMIYFKLDFVMSMHKKVFPITSTELKAIYFQYLAFYKLLIIVFNLVPYLVLSFM